LSECSANLSVRGFLFSLRGEPAAAEFQKAAKGRKSYNRVRENKDPEKVLATLLGRVISRGKITSGEYMNRDPAA
jgi:hypothetical protein